MQYSLHAARRLLVHDSMRRHEGQIRSASSIPPECLIFKRLQPLLRHEVAVMYVVLCLIKSIIKRTTERHGSHIGQTVTKRS